MKLALSLSISAPGAGKGTQAEKLAKKLNLVQFDTGTYLQTLLHSPEAESDPILKREQINFNTGKLVTPSWILGQAKKEAERIASQGNGVVFSGSPRTMYEAFGDSGADGLTPKLAALYGKENCYFIQIDINEATTLERNSKRVICSKGGFPIFNKEDEERCKALGGSPEKRILDAPEVIKVRIKEYKERTYPIIERLRSEEYNVIEVDGTPLPDEVFKSILEKLNLH